MLVGLIFIVSFLNVTITAFFACEKNSEGERPFDSLFDGVFVSII